MEATQWKPVAFSKAQQQKSGSVTLQARETTNYCKTQNKGQPAQSVRFSGEPSPSLWKKRFLYLLTFLVSLGLASVIVEKENPDYGILLGPQAPEKAHTYQPTSATLQRLQNQVTELAHIPRETANPQQLDEAARYIRKQWEALGLQVKEQPFTLDGKAYQNLWVSFEPENPNPEQERVIIGAHYDTVKGSPGADDNASGVVGLLELARQLQKDSTSLKAPVDLVAYTLEEVHRDAQGNVLGARGSKAHVDYLKKHDIPVRGMISLEMIGFFSDKKGTQSYPLSILKKIYPDSADFIAVVGYQRGKSWVEKVTQAFAQSGTINAHPMYLPLKLEALPLHRSDHSSYIDGGIPALMLTDTAEFRNHTYHTEKDTPEKLNYTEMAKVIQGVYYFLKTL